MKSRSNSAVPEYCIWCGGSLGAVKYHNVSDGLGYVSGHWDLVECNDCKSLTLSPFPSPTDVMAYYPENYNIPSPTQTSGIRKFFSALEQRFLSFCYKKDVANLYRKLPIFKKEGLKILEIGCGNGNRMEFFHHLNLDILGVDMSKADVEAIQAKGMKALCMDIHSLTEQFQPNSFDVIMSFDLLEHIPNLETFFKKICTLLKPGGWMVAGLPASDSYVTRIVGERYPGLDEVPRHVTVPSPAGAMMLFRRFEMARPEIYPYNTLGCSIALGTAMCRSASSHLFYRSSFNLFNAVKRICAVAIMFLSAPIFFLENRLTKHPSRFIVCAQKS